MDIPHNSRDTSVKAITDKLHYTSVLKKPPPVSRVRKEARERSEKIFIYWDILGKILERHEDLLRKRWAKKSRKQRKEVRSHLNFLGISWVGFHCLSLLITCPRPLWSLKSLKFIRWPSIFHGYQVFISFLIQCSQWMD